MKKTSARKKPRAYLGTLCILLFVAMNPAWAQQVQKVTNNRVKALLKAGKPALGVMMWLPGPPLRRRSSHRQVSTGCG